LANLAALVAGGIDWTAARQCDQPAIDVHGNPF